MQTMTFPDPAKQLKKGREDLITSFLKGGCPNFERSHAILLDEYFIESFTQSMVGPRMRIYKKPYAMIALGGYGRMEQCIHSDIDLLFLFQKNVPNEAEELIREIIYPLWDLGLEVGHATLSLKEAVELASREQDAFTAMLDARFICGMSPLYSELQDRLGNRIVRGRANKLIAALIDRNNERHQRFGDSTYLLEPNLKEGQGGLRDYHTMLWVSRVRDRLKNPRDLEYHGYLSHDEYRGLRKALGFIWYVRNRLHFLAGRKSDQLHFEYQQKIASILKFKDTKGQLAVERFLGELHKSMDFVKQHNLIFVAEAGYSRPMRLLRKPPKKETRIQGLVVERNTINFESLEAILADPSLLLQVFAESARLKIPLGSEARRIVREFDYIVNKKFRRDPENVAVLEKILATPAVPFNVLYEMLNTGMLERLVPEFKQIRDRIQFDKYHLFPVDRHSIHTVRTLKDLAMPKTDVEDPLAQRIFKEIGKYRKALLWAALLHDIGKGGDGARHADHGAILVKKILSRFGYGQDLIETVSFLIKEHLFLIKTATRRDINDEETAVFCARRINDAKRLKMLYLLTVADSIATGPKAWNDWSAALLRDLFFKVLKIIERGELASLAAVEEVQRKKKEIVMSAASDVEREKVSRHFDQLSPRYLLYTPAENVAVHMELYEQLGNDPFVWRIDRDDTMNTRTITICARDRLGLFSRISGVFTLNGLDILNAEIYTWRNSIALDIFTVTPPVDQLFEDERWKKAATHLKKALSGDLDLSAAIAEKISEQHITTDYTPPRPVRIHIDNDTSSFFTIIEIFANDAPGLLFNITDALYRLELDVRIAKIATKVDQVVDVFYVRDQDGQKADTDEQTRAIEQAIHTVLKTTGMRGNEAPIDNYPNLYEEGVYK